jgi:hypothetical protein
VTAPRFDRVFPVSEVERIRREAEAVCAKLRIVPSSLSANHRLRRVYEAVDRDLELHRADGDWDRLPDAIELSHTTEILEHPRSRNWLEPQSLVSAMNYAHDLTLMATATYVAESGNDVRPHQAKGPGARPDMWIHVGADSGPIEHKTSLKLDEPTSIAAAEADRIVNDAFTSADHQNRGTSFAMVSLGAFRTRAADLDAVRAAADRMFALEYPELRHVVGALLFSVGLARGELPGALPGNYGDRHPRAGPHAAFGVEIDPRRFLGHVVPRWAPNPAYSGKVPMRPKGSPGPAFFLPFASSQH